MVEVWHGQGERCKDGKETHPGRSSTLDARIPPSLDFPMTTCYLVQDEHVPERARFPVIDAHNHLWANWRSVPRVVEVMDAVGVRAYGDLTANISLSWADGGYVFKPGRIEDFLEHALDPYPDRFFGFTTALLAQPTRRPLFDDPGPFVEETIALFDKHVAMGARGLKVLKELGLHYRDAADNLIGVDDPRLAPIWDEAARLGVPVLIHQGDPDGFFEPIGPENEHKDSLLKYPSWSFADPARFPRKRELLERRDRLVDRHRKTTFILPHVANRAEDLGYVDRLLRDNANVFIDCSARSDELGRQPYTAREFMIKHQNRILFGTDMPTSVEMYRFYFRFLETRDEAFVPPDYDGTFERYRWRVCGLGLPDDVLEKIYYKNALRIIPGLKV